MGMGPRIYIYIYIRIHRSMHGTVGVGCRLRRLPPDWFRNHWSEAAEVMAVGHAADLTLRGAVLSDTF